MHPPEHPRRSEPGVTGPDPAAAPAAAIRPATVAWVLLDWAASGFSTVSITLLVAYVEKVVFAGAPWGVPGGVVWAWTIAVAMLVSAAVTPFAAAFADRRHAHQAALLASVAGGGIACLLLGLVPPEARAAVVLLVAAASVGFDLSAIFTGSLLAGLATGPRADRLSAAGFAAGYAGGAVALAVAAALVAAHDRFGLTAAGGLRAAFALTGVWWLVFSLPAAATRLEEPAADGHATTSAGELAAFGRSLVSGAESRGVGNVLVGAVLALGAVQTAIAQFSTLALEAFHLDAPALVRLVLLVQAVALPGALAIGWLSGRIGRPAALGLCLAGWVAVLVLAWFVQTPAQLTALAVLLALVLGGVQSVIRATVAVLAPPGRAGVTFGAMQVGTKLAGFVAGLLFGGAFAVLGHPRGGLLTLLAQVLLGWWFLARGQASPSTSRIE
jgi:UMF1 family MFS transporter